MALESGSRLGAYEILAAIGAGGMGEVYRARDTKLGREVAIKVLPEEFTQHPQKLARFEREARFLAALNHPGIATLHGLEEAEGKPFLVMELVEGETLAERIERGPIPPQEALQLSLQIAEALEAAHEKGVIHRDLKPANIKVDPEGHVKVLDFGLAKAFAEEVPEGELSASPTLSRDATRAGVILGTAAYMSPEQAKGKTVDKRSDIFSFGIVLYEMLTGKRAFAGEDVSEVLAGIIKMEPDWKAVPSVLDPRVQNLLRRCLTKDRKNRLQAVGDVRVEIQEILADPTGASAQQPLAVSAPSRARERVAWGLVAALLGGIVVWSVMRAEPPAQAILRFALTLPPGDIFTDTGRHLVALSPDGTRLVYSANEQLYLREMDQLEATPIRGTDMSPTTPFFSPDGQWVGFYAGGNLRKVSVTGGAPITLCDARNLFGASWGRDDSIVFGQGRNGILRVSANGGTPEVLIPMDSDKNESGHGPQMLPDGKTVLFTLGTTALWDESQIVTQSLETGERRVLIEGGRDARYVPTGHLVYALGETLLAVPFDLERLEVMGGPVPVVEDVGRAATQTGAAHASFSDSGSLAYVPVFRADRRIVWFDRGGQEQEPLGEPGIFQNPELSPDGKRLAVLRQDPDSGNVDIWIIDLERGVPTRFTFDEAVDLYAVWSPDGSRIVFNSARDGGVFQLYEKPASGAGTAELLRASDVNNGPFDWSSDGRFLIYVNTVPTRDIWALPMLDEGEPVPFLEGGFMEDQAKLSPDGRWIAYISDESGRNEVYVANFQEALGKWQISTGGGVQPRWSNDGTELFYIAPDLTMMAVPVRGERELEVGVPVALFETGIWGGVQTSGGRRAQYDVAADGRRFLMIRPAEEAQEAEIHIVLDWFEELKRLVPTN